MNTKKIVSELMAQKYGRTRAEWQLIEDGKEWDGSLIRKAEIHKHIKEGVKYTLLPYYGGLYQSKIEMWGEELKILINQ